MGQVKETKSAQQAQIVIEEISSSTVKVEVAQPDLEPPVEAKVDSVEQIAVEVSTNQVEETKSAQQAQIVIEEISSSTVKVESSQPEVSSVTEQTVVETQIEEAKEVQETKATVSKKDKSSKVKQVPSSDITEASSLASSRVQSPLGTEDGKEKK